MDIPLCRVIVHSSLWQFGSASAASSRIGSVFHILTVVSIDTILSNHQLLFSRNFQVYLNRPLPIVSRQDVHEESICKV